jgi:glyceraldehyde 3-phosphate dehydrogenase
MKNATENEFKNIVSFCDEPLVSIDFTHNPHSAIFDSTATFVMGDNFCRVSAWYDNEWAFAIRMLDVARLVL